MVLFTARPFKHPTTGVYYFRKAVPADLKPVLGKSEVKQSLSTKDPAQACELFSAVAAQVAAEWKLLRAEPAALTRKQELALAGRWYLWFTAQHEDDPGHDAEGWRLLADQFEDTRQVGIGAPDEPDGPRGVQGRVESLLVGNARTADFLLSEGVALSAEGRTGFLRALEPQFFAALRLLSRWSEGDYRPDRHPEQFPQLRLKTSAAPAPEPAVTLTSIFDGWAGERQPPEKTRYSWRRIVDQFQAHLGHEDALRVTKADVVAWKDALVSICDCASASGISSVPRRGTGGDALELVEVQPHISLAKTKPPAPRAARALRGGSGQRPDRFLLWLVACLSSRAGQAVAPRSHSSPRPWASTAAGSW